MIDLPAGLAPWASELAMLPTDLALALAPWVGRLAMAIGPMSEIRTSRAGEPDGYGGLTQRGSYERLLTAEWGIADLFPDEFLRRAAAGEHLFLDLARRGPRGARRTIAIVSAGPAQLGAPRLAHLAVLIVLARRAAIAGAGFAWGVLEDPAHALSDGLDAVAIRRVLDARTSITAAPGAVEAWRDALAADRDDEWWCVAAERDAIAARRAGAAALAIRDVLDPAARALDVEVRRRGGTPARVRLDLPAPDLCARLLRDPLGRGGGARVAMTTGVAMGVRFVDTGSKLLVELAGGALECWPIPGSPREQLGKPRRWTPPAGQRLVACGAAKKSILAATVEPSDPTTLVLSFGTQPVRMRVTLPEPAASELARHLAEDRALPRGLCGQVKSRSGDVTTVIEAAPGHLVKLDDLRIWPAEARTFDAAPLSGVGGPRAGAVIVASVLAHHELQWVELRRGGAAAYVARITPRSLEDVASIEIPPAHDGTTAAHFGFAHRPAIEWGPVAVALGHGAWAVAATPIGSITMQAEAPVVGVGWQNGAPMLLLQVDERRLAWVTSDRRDELPAASAPIAAVAVCPHKPLVAWLTTSGEVVVYSMHYRAVVMWIAGGRR